LPIGDASIDIDTQDCRDPSERSDIARYAPGEAIIKYVGEQVWFVENVDWGDREGEAFKQRVRASLPPILANFTQRPTSKRRETVAKHEGGLLGPK
jgi:hypothetical protein